MRVETQGRVQVVTFDRPERRNALDRRAVADLADVLTLADSDPSVGAVVLTGAPPAFSAGADLDELGDQLPGSGRVLGPEYERLFDTLAHLSVPLVAAVDGAAVGLGAVLLLYCDVVLLAPSARLRFPFVALGVTTEGGVSSLLPRLVGDQRAARLLLTAAWVGADEAVAIGLATEVVADVAVRAEAAALAGRIAEQSRDAVRATKRLLAADRRSAARRGRAAERSEWTALRHAGPRDPRRPTN